MNFNIFNFENPVKSITVHGGIFHADDVACAALLKLQYPDIKIIRTNNPDTARVATECVEAALAATAAK